MIEKQVAMALAICLGFYDKELEEKREIVREAFQEMKKIEVARDRAQAAAVVKENRFEQTELDEIALQKHTRKLSGADF